MAVVLLYGFLGLGYEPIPEVPKMEKECTQMVNRGHCLQLIENAS